MGAGLLSCVLAATATATAQAPAASPAAAGASSDNPETIIVTGERTRRSLKDTPSSVTVFDRKDIERLGAPDRLQDLLQNVPNVLVPNHRDTPVIRGQRATGVLSGLGGFFGGARPRTVLQVDGRTLSFAEFLNTPEGLWDVDHVEVFVSPQTTTQGANSIGGAIFIHTAEPTFKPQERVRAIAGSYRRRQLSAVASGPLLDDQLAFRLAVDDYRSVSTTRMSGPIAGVDDINPDRFWSVKAKLLAKPAALPGLSILTTYTHSHSQAPQAELATSPVRERRDDFYIYGYIQSNVDSVATRVDYSIDPALEWRTTGSLGWLHYRRFAPEGFGQNRIDGRDRSLESVVDWKPEGRFSAIGGVAYQRFDLNPQFIALQLLGLGTGTFKDRQPSAGLFGEASWRATDRLTLTAGARYQVDSKRRTGVLTMSPPLLLDYDASSRAFLPKLSAAYDVSDRLRFGLLIERAYNPGGVTLDQDRHAQLEFRPEYMWDYEFFTRASLLGGRLTLNANLFYNDMRDAQRELDFDLKNPLLPFYQIVNEPRAEAHGAEFMVMAKPWGGLTLNAAVGYLKTKVTKGVAITDPYIDEGFFGAPSLTASGGVDWVPVRRLRFSTQVRRVAGYAGDDFNTPDNRTRGFWMADGRASWDTKRFTIFAYGQNLFNTFRILNFAGPIDSPNVEAELTDPRQIGIGIEARF